MLRMSRWINEKQTLIEHDKKCETFTESVVLISFEDYLFYLACLLFKIGTSESV